jgi:UDP-glucose 4-epimerase
MKTVLITGASGFVGQRFCVNNKDRYLIKTVSLQNVQIEDLDLSGVDVILHLAGIAHRMEKTDDSLYFEVNYELTKKLAEAAKQAGVGHFLFVSTIKVYGDDYELLTPETACRPNDAYGKSKLMAEEALKNLESRDFGISIVRPPLIYGQGVKGNMQKLMALVQKRKYIPLGNINNKRSMLGLDNFVALLDRVIETSKSGTFLIQDSKPVSTSRLISEIAKGKNIRIKLISIPWLVRFTIKKIAPEIYKRLFGSLVVDDSATRNILDFEPPYSFEEGIRLMAKNN